MGILMIRCPKTGYEISTQREFDLARFKRSIVFFGRTRCPFCLVEHEWFSKDAWVAEKTNRTRP